MHPRKLLSISLWFLLESLFFQTGLSHGGHSVKKSFVKLILISFDGFRWDYLDLVKKHGKTTPNFDELVKSGSSSAYGGIKNAFITKTFPNHYTLATGFYEESHGIMANSFYDPEFNETFDITNPSAKEQKWWDGKSGKPVEPIWMTNEKCECGKKSGVVFWPGSDVENQRPKYLLRYNSSISNEMKINEIVEWFLEHDPINFGMVYIDEPDRTGHKHGPESKEVVDKVVELDGLLGLLMTKLKEGEIFEGMNFIVTSDHGMVMQTEDINLDDYLDPESYKTFGSSPVLNMLPRKGKEDEIYKKLKEVPHLIVYKKEEIPDEYHYKNNRRVMPLLVTAEEGFKICFKNSCRIIEDQRLGDHGYNNTLNSMHPIFVASGPAFRKNYKIDKPFETVDVYSLMCHVLDVTPHVNEGDFNRAKQVLLQSDRNLGEDIVFLGVILLVVGVAVTFSLCTCYNHHEHFRKRKFSNNLNEDVVNEDGRKHLLTSEEDEENSSGGEENQDGEDESAYRVGHLPFWLDVNNNGGHENADTLNEISDHVDESSSDVYVRLTFLVCHQHCPFVCLSGCGALEKMAFCRLMVALVAVIFVTVSVSQGSE